MSVAATLSTAPLIGFDTETTGVRVHDDRIVTAAVITTQDGRKVERSWLINPGVEIPSAAAEVHGITTETARASGAEPATALDEIATALADGIGAGGVVVAFNATFDLSVLDAELARYGLPTMPQRLGRPVAPVADPLVIDRAVDRYRRGKRTLGHLCDHYGVASKAFHSADGDVTATLELLLRMVAAHPQIGQASVAELHEMQVGWHRDWAENFEQYLHSKGRAEARISRAWPIGD